MTTKKLTWLLVSMLILLLFNRGIVLAEEKRKLGIKDLIFQVENEILQAQKEHEKKNEKAMFAVNKLVLKVQFQTKYDVKGGIKIWVVEAGMDVTKGSLHEITLELEPFGMPIPAVNP